MTLSMILRGVAADSSLALGLKVLSVPIQYLAVLVMARWYGAELVGTYFLALNLGLALAVVCRLGLDKGLLRFVPTLQADNQTAQVARLLWPAVKLTGLLSLLAGLALYGAADWLAVQLHAPALRRLILFAALSLPFLALAFLLGEVLRGMGGARFAILREFLITPGSFLLCLLMFAHFPPRLLDKTGAVGWAMLVSVLLGLGFLLVLLRLPASRTAAAGAPPFRELLHYSWPLYLLSLFALLNNEMSSLILGWFAAPAEVAAFNTAVKIVPLIVLPLQAINAVVPPLFARLYHKGDTAGLEFLARTTAQWMYHLALPAALLIILLGSDILGLLGPEFLQARFILAVLAIAQLINVATGSVGFLLMMTGEQRLFALLQVTVGLASALFMTAGAAFFGLNGLGLAKALGLAGINLAAAGAVWRRLKLRPWCHRIFWANLGGALGVGMFAVARPQFGPLVAGALFCLGYLAVVGKPLLKEFQGALGLFNSESV